MTKTPLFANLAPPVLRRFIPLGWLGKVEGTENIPKRPCIVIANHASYLDFLLIAYLFEARLGKQISFWAKSKVTRHRLWAPLAKRCKAIEIKPHNHLRSLVDQTEARLLEQFHVCIFPEGRRSRDGQLSTFQRGYLHVALALSVPIVPIRIENAYRAWAPNETLPKPIRCNLTIGKAHNVGTATRHEDFQALCQHFQLFFEKQIDSTASLKRSEPASDSPHGKRLFASIRTISR